MHRKHNHNRMKQADYLGMENQLQSVLRPLSPRPEFIWELRARLQALKDNPEGSLPDGKQFMLILAFSMLAMFAVVVMSIRVALVMASALGLLQQYRRQPRRLPAKSVAR